MKSQMSFTDAEYEGRKRQTKREEFLTIMDHVIPWDEWVKLIEPHYPDGKRGRPVKGAETMLRMYLLQNWFNLSDEGVEDAIYDSYAFRRFMGINFMETQAPDATTLCRFRSMLNESGITKQLFDSMRAFLDKHGKLMHGGTIVDATIIDASSSTKNAQGKRDPEMRQTKKGSNWYFGVRLHAGADAGTGYLHSVELTPANVSERSVVPKLVRDDDEVVYGDAGYCGIEKQATIKQDKHLSQIDWRVNTQKPYRKHKWERGEGTRWYEYMEYRKSRVRSKVEYVFFIIKRIFGYRKVRYRGIAKNKTHALMLGACANLYMLTRSGYEGVASLTG
jgi:IS5 family transposase